ncbi:Nif3-like dinuclear metal center hexameric protein [Campylobacter geochelonis]|uniref:GTP cyclohydrolase 1 type 2 homolog n=1 Tax=Campylobacter geochelonis TaxID=1780362 RepID=A0A128ELE8_9BACT|nr:Nif3-like dinuclear metal center hexameric protein [Campylobacter geochelonis]QKF70925.1 Nif3-like dinuclear metal center protein, putative GTP cyclohydrolase [Campylobacter geochelonis]CZE46973.1 metal-binding protein [Campylobacter geochelonis]CZE49073.1 metal-binding protein [Campylobacter geochelonis]CZE51228.1 metal-binding protein [Campylobacter geochelonis]
MKIREIYQILDQLAPFQAQEEWDNSGLLVGSMDDEFKGIYASLDLDLNLVKNAKPNSLFITHHPLIFKGLKRFDGVSYPTKLLKEMIKKDIKLISMHTNYDKFILNKFVAKEVLAYKITKVQDFLVFMEVDMSFDELIADIKAKFNIANLRTVRVKEHIKTIALCTGSGADLLGSFEVDCFLTGDLKYHSALESLENGISIIDINHYESELFFADSLAKNLQKNKIEVIISNSINPFTYS